MALSDEKRAQLDGIVQKMDSSGASTPEIQAIVDDFKKKYAAPEQDAFQKAVNYRTGNNYIDAPMGVVQGAAKGAAEIGTTIGAITRKATGRPQESAEEKDADTKPSGIGQGTGKFLEQAAEYAAPAGYVGRATKTAGLLARSLAQAGTGAVVSAAQTQGNPNAIALGAGLGAAGEVAGAAVKGVRALAGAKPVNLQNTVDAFKAVPTQKGVIKEALPILERDGFKPSDSILDTQAQIKGKLEDIGKQYDALPSDVKAREAPAQEIIDRLKLSQQQYMRNGVVTDDASYNAIQDQIKKVEDIAAANHKQAVLYHGSNVEVSKIDPSKLQARNEGFSGKGFYLSPDKFTAEAYGPKMSTFSIAPGAKVLHAGTYGTSAEPGLLQKVRDFYDANDIEQFDAHDRKSWSQAVDKYAQSIGADIVHYGKEVVVKNPDSVIANPSKNLSLEDIVHLKQKANGRTNFTSTPAEQNVWRDIGDAYRATADTIAPETTPLNRDFATYKKLERVVDKNVDFGRGTTESGLDVLERRAGARHVGAGIGASVGGALGGPVGAGAGALIGGIAGPKLAKTTVQILRNAADSGAFESLPKAKQVAVGLAARAGDNQAILRILQTESATASQSQ